MVGCKKETEKKENSVVSSRLEKVEKVSFSDFKKQLAEKSKAEKSKYFFSYINNDVPYYWTGTPWSFGGTTKEPQKGSIACGYFVTHVLKDYGFELNTSYLAQQASSVMIKKLCNDIHYFSSVKDLENYILSKEKNQVYIVGLDFHTGFITREDKDTYFIHSSYIQNEGVKKEKTSESPALNASKSFMIGSLKC